MENKSSNYKLKLGLFVLIGIIIFFLAIFIVGKQKNLFNPVYQLSANFKNVSGLQVGNTVRFSGINIGTVDHIKIINDSTVKVDLLIKKEVQQFIKEDSNASIGSEGIIGDKVLILSHGSIDAPMAKEKFLLTSNEPIETDAIIRSLKITADNSMIASAEIAEILMKVNNGEGTLGKLINDEQMADKIDKTIENLKSSSKSLDENMEAAKHNFLLRGYFRKKEKQEEKEKKEAAKKIKEEKK